MTYHCRREDVLDDNIPPKNNAEGTGASGNAVIISTNLCNGSKIEISYLLTTVDEYIPNCLMTINARKKQVRRKELTGYLKIQ